MFSKEWRSHRKKKSRKKKKKKKMYTRLWMEDT